jgi:hypothetical protein
MDEKINLSELRWGLTMYKTNKELLKSTTFGILSYKMISENEITKFMDRLYSIINILNIYSKTQYLEDLNLIHRFNELIDNKPNYYKSNEYLNKYGFPETHRDFFLLEDDSMFWLESLIPWLNTKLSKNISPDKVSDILFSYNQFIYYTKDIFNRPRAYQIAKILNKNIMVLPAKSSLTASCPSGHAFQGYLFGTIIFLLYGDELSMSDDILNLVLNISRDVGNRRVIAGVHYFSDNIVSYYMLRVLLEIEGVYEKAKPFLDKLIDKINMSFS